jgi:hypothetical protein
MRHILALIIVAGCLVTGSAHAQPAQITMLGVQNVTCGTWTQERQVRSQTSWLLGEWVLGFLSAVNATGHQNNDLLAGKDHNGIYGWIENYCKTFPLQQFPAAVYALLDELQHNGDAHKPGLPR